MICYFLLVLTEKLVFFNKQLWEFIISLVAGIMNMFANEKHNFDYG